MAQRRMFNKSITNSSKFLKMPISSRLLYYDLGMNADDDGFVEHFMVLRMTGATMQDLGILELNGLIKIFDDNVLWIKDWKENNYIQKDRYQPSKYLQMYSLDTICIQNVDTGKDSVELEIDNNSSIYDFLQENGFVLAPIHYEIINEWEDNELTRYAIKKAVLNNKYNINYVNTIINSYKKENIKTIQQAKEQEEIFKSNKKNKKEQKTPEWFDKDNTIKETTKEEQEEIDNILKDLGSDKE